MPLHLDVDWQEGAARPACPSHNGAPDPGWRGDLTGELHLDGTPDAAQGRRAASRHWRASCRIHPRRASRF
ncbi:MAG: hypothetical protein WDM87_00445 [Terracidiphilus sp.]